MHHKRRRPKSRRAGCCCGGKWAKQEWAPKYYRVKGLRGPRKKRDLED
jgi:hypothetical protein